MKKASAALLIVFILTITSLAAVWPLASPISQEGTRAEFPGLVISANIEVDTNWGPRNNSFPYNFIYINSNVTVLDGAKLTIMPGTVIKFEYRTSMTVEGTIHADGGVFNPIRFIPYADEPGTLDWKGPSAWNSAARLSSACKAATTSAAEVPAAGVISNM